MNIQRQNPAKPAETAQAPQESLRHRRFYPNTHELCDYLESVLDLGLVARVTNRVDEDGMVMVDVQVYATDVNIESGAVEHWWPKPEGWATVHRSRATWDEIPAILNDSRWGTHHVRAYCLGLSDDDSRMVTDTGYAWYFEFSDVLMDEAHSSLFAFIPSATGAAAGTALGPDTHLTDRARLLLWLCLRRISEDISFSLEFADEDSVVRDDLVLMVGTQPASWWTQMGTAASQLSDAARRGDIDAITPRTPAERVLITLALRPAYLRAAWEDMSALGMRWLYDSLPPPTRNEGWDGLWVELTGDAAGRLLWRRHEAGEDVDTALALYRRAAGGCPPGSWHGSGSTKCHHLRAVVPS